MTREEAIAAAADRLQQAQQRGEPCHNLRDLFDGSDVDAGYAVQRHNTERWRATRRRVGCKIGLTSHAIQAQLGVDQPDYGVLWADTAFADAEPIDLSRVLQPRAEVEVAFVLGRDLTAEQLTLPEVIDAIAYALPAIEIAASRVADWDISIMDTIADNASSGVYVLGTTPRRVQDLDLRLCGMVMERRGDPVSTGAGAACLGNPLTAVQWLARKMVAQGTPLQAGEVVLSGALGPMVDVEPGDVLDARISGLGRVRAVFEGTP